MDAGTSATVGGPGDAGAPARVDLSGDPRRQRRERAMGGLFFTAAIASLAISALILFSLFSNGIDFFGNVIWSDVFSSDVWSPRSDSYSITTLLVASLIVTGIAMLLAVPLGLASAIYLSEYARPRTRRTLKPILEVLAGIPS